MRPWPSKPSVCVSTPRTPPSMFHELVHTSFSTLYEAKIQADEVDDREGHMRSPFPEFIQEHFINHYGLKSLADKQLGKLVTAVRKYSKEGSKDYDTVKSLHIPKETPPTEKPPVN